MLAKPTLAAALMRQRVVQAGAVSCHPPTAPHQKERTRGWRQWVWVRQLPADAGLVQQIPYHQYFLQLGNDFWPEVLHILAASSCSNSFVLLTTRCFVLRSGNSLPNSHHGAGRAQRWLRGQGRICWGVAEKLLCFPSFWGKQGHPMCQMLGTTPEEAC